MRYLGFILILFYTSATAQNAANLTTIRGNVTEINNTPIPFANVALYTSADSKLVTGVTTDENGKFELKAVAGDYFLKITFLSYEEKIVKNILVSNEDLNLKTIQLKPATELLNEVVVTGEKSQMELKLDKRVFNVGKDLNNIGANASEVLDNVPSVTVDVEGNVSLRGSQNVRILIDGRPSGLTGISSPDALRQLQGDMIESIEVITNPSSRYDAEGEVGIINIVLKKNVRQGVNGSFTLNAGNPHNYGASFNVNLRKNKVNLFSSYSFNYRENPGKGRGYNIYKRNIPDSTYSYRQTNKRTRGGTSNNLRLGADYYIDEKNVITGSVLYRISQGRNTSETRYNNFNEDEELFSSELRTEKEKEPEQNIELALSYKKNFKQKDRTWTTDIKIMDNVEDEIADYRQEFSDAPVIYQKSTNTEDERNLLFQSDYIHPLSENGKVEAGVKATSRRLNNNYKVEQLNEEGNWAVYNNLDDHLLYTENIYAAYLMWGNKFNKISIQTGLRGEYSDILSEYQEKSTRVPQKYFNVFPSAHLSYEINENKGVQLSFSYRISRPGFRDLLPFSGISDVRSVFLGNPSLKPEYTHSFETGYLLEWTQGSLLSSAYYRHRLGVIERITLVDSVGFNRIIPVNLATQNAYGLEFNLSHSLQNWWRLNSNFNFYRAVTEGSYNEEKLYSDTYTFTSRITSKITLLKKVDFQTGINYRAPQETPQGKTLSMYSVDLGLSKDVLKGKGTITLNVRDLFNSRIRRTIVDNAEDFYSSSQFQWSRRQILFSFNYRLNQKKNNRNSERNNEMDNGGGDGEM